MMAHPESLIVYDTSQMLSNAFSSGFRKVFDTKQIFCYTFAQSSLLVPKRNGIMAPLGVISGTVFIDTACFGTTEEKVVVNPFGQTLVMIHEQMVFIPRHGRNPNDYILPHRINHQANIQALKDLGVCDIVGINSTGSLKMHLRPGTIVIPDDFIMLGSTPTAVVNRAVHITPSISSVIREELLEAARIRNIDTTDGGVYWQTQGPRFETKAEIAMMSRFADLVGMTMASEAVIAQELGLAYASICSVDNYAHGLGEKALTMDEIVQNAKRNAEAVIRIIRQYMERRRI